jgi:hypothetical protein
MPLARRYTMSDLLEPYSNLGRPIFRLGLIAID